jgi:osomolarity two-component system response regulator SSK1
MPVMDGIQATKEIRRLEKSYGSAGPGTPISDFEQRTPSDIVTADSKNPATPYRSSVIIVALTASSLQSDRVAALAAGCNDFLTKPVSLQWLNNKIIEWGSIKALQMWADLRPEVVKSISSGQAVQAQNVARKLHVPEGRATPGPHSRSSSLSRKPPSTGETSERSSASPGPVPHVPKRQEIIPEALPSRAAAALLAQTPPLSEAGSEAATPVASVIPRLQLTQATPLTTPKTGEIDTPQDGPLEAAAPDEALAAAAAGAPAAAMQPGAPEVVSPPGLAETAGLPALVPPRTPPKPLKAELPPIEDTSLDITPMADVTPTTEATLSPGKTDTPATTQTSSPLTGEKPEAQNMPEKVQGFFDSAEAEERNNPGGKGGTSD